MRTPRNCLKILITKMTEDCLRKMLLAFGNKPQSALHVALGRQEQRNFSPHPHPYESGRATNCYGKMKLRVFSQRFVTALVSRVSYPASLFGHVIPPLPCVIVIIPTHRKETKGNEDFHLVKLVSVKTRVYALVSLLPNSVYTTPLPE